MNKDKLIRFFLVIILLSLIYIEIQLIKIQLTPVFPENLNEHNWSMEETNETYTLVNKTCMMNGEYFNCSDITVNKTKQNDIKDKGVK